MNVIDLVPICAELLILTAILISPLRMLALQDFLKELGATLFG
jgi:hypothetical protein